MSKSGMTVQFRYNHAGLRTQKIVTENGATTTTEYIYHGKLLTHMVQGNDQLHFFYDAQSRPAMVDYNGVKYTYLHNLQGDIVGLLDSTGVLVVEYKYDAWGKPVGVTGSLAATLGAVNHLRYRGYVWDEETGLYYLRSRYYEPEMCRFMNADPLVGAPEALFSTNCYAYCWNDPQNMQDHGGSWPKWLTSVAAVVTAVVATVVIVASAPAAVCAATFALTYYGVGYAAASAIAAVGVAAVGTFAVSGYYSDAIEEVTGTNPIRDVFLLGNEDAYEDYKSLAFVTWNGIFELAAMSPDVCFIEGTCVCTDSGLRAIEEIHVGDLVWAEDPDTGEKALKRVVNTFINRTNELVHLRLNDEEITCTKEHPFFCKKCRMGCCISA